MTRQPLRTQRLLALFVLGALLFNYPLLSLFNLAELWGGIPPLFLYIFGAWALIIAIAAWTAESASADDSGRH